MRTLRFHYDIYSGKALDETRRIYQEHAQLQTAQNPPYFEVILKARRSALEDEIAGEFANYALALTVEERRSAGAGSR